MHLKLDTPIQYVKGVGPKLAGVLRKRDISTIGDLLEYYPRGYEDRRAARNIASLRPDEVVSLKAQVVAVSSFALGRTKRKAYDITVRDNTGIVHCKYFRTPYKGYFERFQSNQWVRVVGKVSMYRQRIEFHHPDIRDVDENDENQDALVPLYTEIEGISSARVRKIIATIFEDFESQRKMAGATTEDIPIPELIPNKFLEQYKLLSRYAALKTLHQPPRDAGREFSEFRSLAHRRIIFEEFFWLELYLASRRAGVQREHAQAMLNNSNLVEKFKKQLPFELTNAQQKAFAEIVNDLTQPHPMHRLIQGDVGSGKTVVALMAAAFAAQSGFQTTIMVPTEILAEQHYQTAQKFLEPLGLKVGLLTGHMKGKERDALLGALSKGYVQICVGTHALIQDDVDFQNLGLVIIDEQHRFGVHQRNQLKSKGGSPHFLVMTATPIPRTLAMTVYGDLDVSVINEMPKGRMPIQTRVVFESKRRQVLDFVRQQLEKGRQAYIVYPLVEESEKIDLKDAVQEFENLKSEFPHFQVGLLHGKMKADEKDEVMQRFRSGQLQILVSTTVIEVGVDVANANIMVIEHAERFGLSQLHQLRGRVGRGEHKSFCILVMGYAVSEEARARTQILETSSDGFKIAEADLEIRGPGEFLGARQSGLPGFKMANLVRDVQILQQAREMAFEIMRRDPQLTDPRNTTLKAELTRAHGKTALASVG